MSKRSWFFVLAMVLVVTLTGCGGAKSAGDDHAAQVGGSKGDGSATASSASEDGSNAQSGGKTLPKNFPKEIPIPQGAILTQSDFTTSSIQDEFDITYSIDRSVKDLVALYEDAIKKAGFAVNKTEDDGDVTLFGTAKADETLSVDCKPDPQNQGKSIVYISLATNPGLYK